jgi:oryzin
VISTSITSKTASEAGNGTSAASPYVAGMVVYLQSLEGLSKPKEIAARIASLATKDVVTDPHDAPNLLLYNGSGA